MSRAAPASLRWVSLKDFQPQKGTKVTKENTNQGKLFFEIFVLFCGYCFVLFGGYLC
jgi:hypothetical protein